MSGSVLNVGEEAESPSGSALPQEAQRSRAFQLRGVSVTYKVPNSKTVSAKTGTITVSYDSTTVPHCLVGQLAPDDVDRSNGRFRIGDRAFRMLVCECPEEIPANTSVVVHNTVEYRVVGGVLSADGLVCVAVARRV